MGLNGDDPTAMFQFGEFGIDTNVIRRKCKIDLQIYFLSNIEISVRGIIGNDMKNLRKIVIPELFYCTQAPFCSNSPKKIYG